MYFKNEFGFVLKTKTGIIADAPEKTTTIEVKPCDNMQEIVDCLFDNAIAELEFYTMMQKNNPNS